MGLGLLRLSPRDFWAMTPREFCHVVRVVGGGADEAPERRAFEALMAMFPDGKERQVE